MLDADGDLGQVVIFGTPAEEGGGGKVMMINKGCFDEVDFCLMAHPYVENIIYHPELAIEHLQITYHGKFTICFSFSSAFCPKINVTR